MNAAPRPAPATDAALLLLRIAVGLTFFLHGLDKLRDLDGTEQYFDGLGIPVPGVMAVLVGTLELLGGIALIAGLLLPVVGVGLALDMLVAGLTAHTGSGFFVTDGGFELVLVLGVAALCLAVTGAGRLSVDAALRLGDRIPGYPGALHRADPEAA